jgi:hypothetical protein
LFHGQSRSAHRSGFHESGHRALREAHRYGKPGARPKAYLQASLHADEIPGMLAAHHLIGLLDDADKRGEIKGEIIVVPVANPVGAGRSSTPPSPAATTSAAASTSTAAGPTCRRALPPR